MTIGALLAVGCRAQPADRPQSEVRPFSPAQVRTLESYGAFADGRSDDSEAIKRAFEDSDRYCLEGKGRTYRVSGTLRVTKNLCLRNAILLQTAAPMDTAPYITRGCPNVPSASAMIDCGDPAIPPEQASRLLRSLSVRTLLIRPAGDRPILVNLDHVKIDRGPYAEGGSRTDSAGIWLDGADRVDFRNVEITGSGKGYGLFVMNARNVTLSNLWIHDLTWEPYRGDTSLSEADVAAVGWNSVPVHEIRERGRGGAKATKFYGVRIQEQLTCALVANVSHVKIENARIERCMARFDTRNLPWQADGLDIGQSSTDVVIDGAKIESTWEGVDVVAGGNGIDRLRINNLSVSNSFSFGLKMGYQLRNVRVSRLNIQGAGLSGVVLYGPVRDVQISSALIKDVGIVRSDRSRYSPWRAGNRAGVRFDEGSGTADGTSKPDNIILKDVAVSGPRNSYEFGILNTGGTNIQIAGFHAEGFGRASIQDGRGR